MLPKLYQLFVEGQEDALFCGKSQIWHGVFFVAHEEMYIDPVVSCLWNRFVSISSKSILDKE